MQLDQGLHGFPGEREARFGSPIVVRPTIRNGRGQGTGEGKEVKLAGVARNGLIRIHDLRRPRVLGKPPHAVPFAHGLGRGSLILSRQVIEVQFDRLAGLLAPALVDAVELLLDRLQGMQVAVPRDRTELPAHRSLGFARGQALPRRLHFVRGEDPRPPESDGVLPILERVQPNSIEFRSCGVLGLRFPTREEDRIVNRPRIAAQCLAHRRTCSLRLVHQPRSLLLDDVGVGPYEVVVPVLDLHQTDARRANGDYVDFERRAPLLVRELQVREQQPLVGSLSLAQPGLDNSTGRDFALVDGGTAANDLGLHGAGSGLACSRGLASGPRRPSGAVCRPSPALAPIEMSIPNPRGRQFPCRVEHCPIRPAARA